MSDERPRTRRQLLAATAGAAGLASLAGCSDGDSASADPAGTAGGDGSPGSGGWNGDDPSGWPMYGSDLQNTGYHPDTTGPSGDVETAWQLDPPLGTRGALIPEQPAVRDGTVYSGSTDGDVWAIDLHEGEIDWEARVDAGVDSTPLVTADTLYVGYGPLYALDRSTGDVEWDVPVEGFLKSPSLVGGDVYVPVELADTSRIVRIAADGSDSEVLHEFESDDISKSLAIAHGRAYVSVADSVAGIDLQSGEEVWRFRNDAGDPMDHAPPVATEDRILATSGFDVYTKQSEDPRVFGLDPESGDVVWEFSGDDPDYRYPPAVAEGVAYVVADGMIALEVSSGDRLWEIDRYGHSKPTVVGDRIYVRQTSVAKAIDRQSRELDWLIDGFGNAGELPSPVVHDGVALFLDASGRITAIA